MTTQTPVRMEVVGQPLDDILPPTTDVAVVEQSPLPVSEVPVTVIGRWAVRHLPVARHLNRRYGNGGIENIDLQRPGLGGTIDRVGAAAFDGVNRLVAEAERVNWREVAVAAVNSETVRARLAAAEPPLGLAALTGLRLVAAHHEARKDGATKRQARFAGAVAAARTVAAARRAA